MHYTEMYFKTFFAIIDRKKLKLVRDLTCILEHNIAQSWKIADIKSAGNRGRKTDWGTRNQNPTLTCNQFLENLGTVTYIFPIIIPCLSYGLIQYPTTLMMIVIIIIITINWPWILVYQQVELFIIFYCAIRGRWRVSAFSAWFAFANGRPYSILSAYLLLHILLEIPCMPHILCGIEWMVMVCVPYTFYKRSH